MANSYWSRRFSAFRDAFRGLLDLLRNHPPAHLHFIAAIVVVVLGMYLGFNTFEWTAVVFFIGLVFTAEAFNTAIEYLTDLVSPEYHPLAGKTKDMAAAAVLCASLAALVVGLIILLPKILQLF